MTHPNVLEMPVVFEQCMRCHPTSKNGQPSCHPKHRVATHPIRQQMYNDLWSFNDG